MTLETVMDKTRLAAFADGELTPEEAAEVVMHLANHPQDQAYVDDLMAANEALAAAFDAPMREPVPAAIEAAIMGEPETAQVIPFRRKPAAVWAGAGLALAASVALAVVVFPGLSGPGSGGERLAVGPVAQGSELAQTLNTLPSGAPEAFGDEGEVMILATLPIDGGYCREVEIIDTSAERIDLGIACTQGAGWQVEVTMSEPLAATGTETGFVTASGTEAQGLQPFLDRLGAGAVLDPAAEAAAIANTWQPES